MSDEKKSAPKPAPPPKKEKPTFGLADLAVTHQQRAQEG